MKMQFAALALVLGSSFVAADSDLKFVNANGSALSDLCIAAAQSEESVGSIAAQLGMAAVVANDVLCNDKPIQRFVTQFRAESATATVYVVSVANQTPETRLCLAALTSDEEFARLKDAHFSDVAVEREIVCNGKPLGQFVRRYQNRLAALQTAATASL
jgi:hypothetical protein